jgi:transcriptional regulator with XRE-family HTH domain
MKNIVKEKMTLLLNNLDWSLAKLADKSDLSYDTIKNLYYGRIENPKIETLISLADAFNVSLDFLVGRINYPTEEFELLRNYRQCSNHGKHFVQAMATFESNYTRFENKQLCTNQVECFVPQPEKENLDKNAIVIPCLELTGSFKDGILYDTSIKRTIKTHLKNAFMSLLIPNDTLANTYYKDDIVFLEKRRPTDGEIAMFHKDNYMYIRQYKKEGNKHILRSLNINTDDIILNSSEFSQYSVVGTCIYIYRRND